MRRLFALLIIAVLYTAPTNTNAVQAPSPLSDYLMSHIEYLAADERDGRGINTPGLDSSAAYIASHFQQFGLEPLFEDDSYYQEIMIGWGATALPGTFFRTRDTTLQLDSGIRPAGFSASDTVAAPVVFAGYGITAPEYEYDDYEDVAVDGKIVAVLEGEPKRDDPKAKFSGEFDTDHASSRTKAINAKIHGAAGLIILPYSANADTLPVLRTAEPYRDTGIPVAYMTRTDFMTLFPRLNVNKLQRSIDLNEAPRSIPVSDDPATLAVEVERNEVPVKNVGAMVTGDDEIIVLGAHYDHLGYGQAGTREPGVNEVHNGADDNASGVAVLLELARAFAAEPPGPTLVFVAFTGEEAGLVGSSHFVKTPPIDLENVELMINFDMVGRMQDEKLTVYGVESAKVLRELAESAGDSYALSRLNYAAHTTVYKPDGSDELEQALAPHRLDLSLTGGGYGASDQTSFYTHEIPVLHLLTALHADYHTPRDDADKINKEGLRHVFNYAWHLVRKYSEWRPELVWVEAKDPSRGAGRGGVGVSMGTIPDFTQPDSLSGYRIQGVTPGSPAARAGLQAMDTIIAIDDILVDNIYDLTYAMGKFKPGDEVAIRYLRDGEEHSTQLTFAASSGRRGGGGPPGKSGGGGQHGGSSSGHPGGSGNDKQGGSSGGKHGGSGGSHPGGKKE